jgi:hypothetical protein
MITQRNSASNVASLIHQVNNLNVYFKIIHKFYE